VTINDVNGIISCQPIDQILFAPSPQSGLVVVHIAKHQSVSKAQFKGALGSAYRTSVSIGRGTQENMNVYHDTASFRMIPYYEQLCDNKHANSNFHTTRASIFYQSF
jgi:hypothetical protein